MVREIKQKREIEDLIIQEIKNMPHGDSVVAVALHLSESGHVIQVGIAWSGGGFSIRHIFQEARRLADMYCNEFDAKEDQSEHYAFPDT